MSSSDPVMLSQPLIKNPCYVFFRNLQQAGACGVKGAGSKHIGPYEENIIKLCLDKFNWRKNTARLFFSSIFSGIYGYF